MFVCAVCVSFAPIATRRMIFLFFRQEVKKTGADTAAADPLRLLYPPRRLLNISVSLIGRRYGYVWGLSPAGKHTLGCFLRLGHYLA